MFKFFSNITLRSLYKRGLFPIINILGLSIGLAVVLLISLLNFYEQSFDRQFKEGKNVYRINAKLTAYMPGETQVSIGNAVGPAIQEAIPEMITTVRTFRFWYHLKPNDNPDNAVSVHFTWADTDFFRLFDTPFIYGTPEDVMSRPNALAISEELSKRIFGDKNPVGETLLNTVFSDQPPMEVVAVYKDYPKNSSLREIQAVGSFMHCFHGVNNYLHWGLGFETFCLLSENADTTSVNAKMQKILADATAGKWDEGEGWFYYPQLQRFTDIHLHSAKYRGGTLTTSLSDIEKVKMLSLLSVIILLVACVNYMNLSTARAQKRSKEIGVSKTIGAKRREIIYRLMLETGFFTLISFVLALVLAKVLLPIFNDLLGEQLYIELALQPMFIGVALLIWMVTTLLAAAYPAIYMSGFPPLRAIRNQFAAKSSHATVRKVLSIGQFAVAIVLIAWVLIIQAQIIFVTNKDLGYNPRNLLGFWGSYNDAMLNDFRAESSVETISRMNFNLLNKDENENNSSILFRDAEDKMGFPLRCVNADPNLIDLWQVKLIAGKHLPEQRPGDTIIQVILNRAAVEYLGMTPEEAIGKRVPIYNCSEVCGVMENFNFESLYRPVTGVCIFNVGLENSRAIFIMLRAKEGRLWENIETYEQIFKKHNTYGGDFGMYFPDLQAALAYDGEKRTERIVIIFSILAIFVACMGVFGLTAFMAEQRTKEIGIRKVMGARVRNIVRLFTSSYVRLLGISLVIAIPAAWWVGNQYLQNFAFRISIGWWIFAVAALVTVILTLLTVSMQAIKAAMKNPVEAIKTE